MAENQNSEIAGYSIAINLHLRNTVTGEEAVETENIFSTIKDTPHLLMLGSADGKPCFVSVGDLFGAEVNEGNAVEVLQKIVALLSR